uniref:PPPDE domain-containing protein n=1 Tax=Aureoumbra lagunensis TaxID=44058 RepID=A0A7S3JSB2_9STRA|mmetsp:Transcript_11773/g.15974  ORF Transcript_11773/g.15974 Transcript_11773/m.15974 type:complete len:247 (+) Transcript_11773:71-811(+)|eukprot:CAMPEP_0197291792 /NCGR_PEP_ID=MMETSP0890-20130614/19060_1 /TAXON_ID=44058 ORGANISM="Aureoumbra lagunensis, Strain CCMP1510" /NCGR_SAMPLE_ID=MMETSP0890 /ASSEMBLY_ACC=CAM_ASM_000533 /LENGTH=246 /DNA_ID=CAMNT_0042765167 /DNA_START=23 /DNA_END=763 /DNA_ORIENTATION=+
MMLCFFFVFVCAAQALATLRGGRPVVKSHHAVQSPPFAQALWGRKEFPPVILPSDNVTCTVYEIGGDLTKVLSTTCSKDLPLIPHVGVRIFDREYFYSDHIESRPIEVMAQMLGTFPQVSFDLGPPKISEEDFFAWLNSAQVENEWCADMYNVFDHNCNHFAKVLMETVASNPLPDDLLLPVLKVTEEMLSELPDWRRNLGLTLMNQVTRLVVVSWGRATRSKKKNLEELTTATSSHEDFGDKTLV